MSLVLHNGYNNALPVSGSKLTAMPTAKLEGEARN